ncbi:ABC transporter substrate-binding protein [Glaciimonas sp. GS1]|uniref:ABC transporter substrate-binding protein n=2 Tax=Glaciimonas soli TaxID=2590999 RepID=A0A843YR01_9BURK|nr:ABC transporter substrate-binding protein [Glaciimonas soli]MQR01965.1 ABC transporter substrate-binding protein [Glaciimonas soli]
MNSTLFQQRRSLLLASGALGVAMALPSVVTAATKSAASTATALPITSATTITPQRVAVAGGAITEVVYALDAQKLLIGADTTSTWPAAAQSLAKIGYQRALSAEGVLSLRPDLLLTSAEAGPPAALAQIAAAGVQVIKLGNGHDVQTVRDRIRGTAAALNLSPCGKNLLQRFDMEWQATLAEVDRNKSAKPLRVMFILSNSGTQAMVAGRDTAADAMIRYAGAVNVLGGDDGFKGYKPLTAESAVAAAPDVLLITREGLAAIGGVDKLVKSPGISITPAAKNRRVAAEMDSLLLLGFGPRLPQAVMQLSKQIYAS